MIKTKSKIVVPLILAFIFISYVLASYELTVLSPYSICLKKASLVGPRYKIDSVLRFVDEIEDSHNRRIFSLRDKSAPCCDINKGGGDTPVLDLSDYLAIGAAHYVKVKEYSVGLNARESSQRVIKEISVPVDNCGKPLSYGAVI